MPTIADLLGCPHEIEHNGKVYKLRESNQLEQGKFTRWLEDRAWAAVERAAAGGDAQLAERLEKNTTRDIAAGVYEFGGEASATALQTPVGVSKMIHFILQSEDPAATEKEARDLFESHTKRSLAALAGGVAGDPKAAAAVLALLGLPGDFLKPNATSANRSRTRRSTKAKRKSGR